MSGSMANPSIVIFGKGYLGERFAEHFGGRAELVAADITRLDDLQKIIVGRAPEVVINAAGKTLTSEIEKFENRSLAYDVNVHGPANLAYLARTNHFHLFHISTDMVYGGPVPEEGWRETDALNPANYYAWTKAWADLQLAPFAERDRISILRIRTPLSARNHTRNLLNKLQGFASVVDVPSSLTVVEDLLEVVGQMMGKKTYGLFNVVNPGVISLYDIAMRLQQAGLIAEDKTIQRIAPEDLNVANAASGNAAQPFPVLNTEKLQATGIYMRDVTKAVQESITSYNSTI
jgi:dTDP-4-dehydrorhamnose reductase